MGKMRWLCLYVAVVSIGFALANFIHWACIFITTAFVLASPWILKDESESKR